MSRICLICRMLLLLLLLFRMSVLSSCYISGGYVRPQKGTNDDRGRRPWQLSLSSSSAASASPPRALRPVFVTDESSAAAANLALRTFQILTGIVTLPSSGSPDHNANPQGRMPVHLVQYLDELEQPKDKDFTLHFAFDAASISAVSNIIPWDSLTHAAFLGIGFHCDYDNTGNAVALEMAEPVGSVIQQSIQYFSRRRSGDKKNGDTSRTLFISLDMPLHLALLRANALPNSQCTNTPPPHGDSYHVAMPEGGSTLIHYFYDHQNTMGGSDPLLCQTKETLIETPLTNPSKRRSIHLSAAYTTLCGQGLNPIASAVVAASVATILGDDDDNTAVSFNMLERTVQLCHHIRQYGSKEQPSGFIRQKYKEFGYR